MDHQNIIIRHLPSAYHEETSALIIQRDVITVFVTTIFYLALVARERFCNNVQENIRLSSAFIPPSCGVSSIQWANSKNKEPAEQLLETNIIVTVNSSEEAGKFENKTTDQEDSDLTNDLEQGNALSVNSSVAIDTMHDNGTLVCNKMGCLLYLYCFEDKLAVRCFDLKKKEPFQNSSLASFGLVDYERFLKTRIPNWEKAFVSNYELSYLSPWIQYTAADIKAVTYKESRSSHFILFLYCEELKSEAYFTFIRCYDVDIPTSTEINQKENIRHNSSSTTMYNRKEQNTHLTTDKLDMSFPSLCQLGTIKWMALFAITLFLSFLGNLHVYLYWRTRNQIYYFNSIENQTRSRNYEKKQILEDAMKQRSTLQQQQKQKQEKLLQDGKKKEQQMFSELIASLTRPLRETRNFNDWLQTPD